MLAPKGTTAPTRLRVYLEGDGHAWATATQPSLDPSPHNLLVARLAVDDPTPNAYLARPCQFVMAPTCEPALWTDRRFSQEVVTSLSQALDQMKQRYGNREYELVGYSGVRRWHCCWQLSGMMLLRFRRWRATSARGFGQN